MFSISSSVNVSFFLLYVFFSPDKALCSHFTLHLVHILELPYYSVCDVSEGAKESPAVPG